MNYQIITKYYIILRSHLSHFKRESENIILALYTGSGPSWQKEDMHRLITDHKQITAT